MVEVERVLDRAIAGGAFPGCAAAWGAAGDAAFELRRGGFTYCPESPRVDWRTVWDLASVTKAVGCATAAMVAEQEGLLDLDRPVALDLPEFGAGGKEAVTPRDLLAHRSGLPAFRPLHRTFVDAGGALASALATPLANPRGARAVYSDLGMIAMGALIARLARAGLDAYLEARVFGPLGMGGAHFRPDRHTVPLCAPTEPVEPWRRAVRRHQRVEPARTTGPDGDFWIQGEVHDPNAMVLGGVAGHAGLFANLEALVRFCSALLQGRRPFDAAQLEVWTRRRHADSTRALGWDTRSEEGSSAGSRFSMRSIGHTGYTGTSVWIDLEKGRFAVLLTNRVHPNSRNLRITAIRPAFHDAVAEHLDRLGL
jgi:CubicO group peptidase (beta-lactamase class C family)